ncbi:cytochrome P450 [Aspergillus sclerotiicarbonarius CBS 121057]|uniref:Cytochrome P450 n=1 Tax=Aspergillus sclerotiicarbonarius (strain CBS 121057 / IBT 28362) TaxID=1448318 RepID=A0A319ETM5_ASPSB|nr:cytochrome P450 [Aspergillus sclerotiicarbonarius CBS 121057]
MSLHDLLSASSHPDLVAVLFITTALIIYTKIYFRRDRTQAPHDGSPIPSAPSWIPLLRNTIPFLFNSHQYLVSLRHKFGSSPVRLFVGGQKIIYMPHSDGTATKMLKSRDLTQTPLIIKHLRDNFGMPEQDLHLYFDKSDSNPSQEDHRALHTLLSGTTLETFADITATQLTKSIEKKRAEWTDWVELPDLYTFVRDELSRAQMYALCGEEIFKVAPDLMHDFWDFDEQLPNLFKGLPGWMIPKARASRDKMAAHIREWHTRLRQSDPPNPDTTAWDPMHGLRLMSSRRKIWHGMSPEGQVVQDLGLIRASALIPPSQSPFPTTPLTTSSSISNSTAATIWPILSTLQSPTLTPRILAATAPHFTPHSLTFNRQTLTTIPLLNSLYLESLRYSTAVAIMRQPRSPGTKISNHTFNPSDSLLALNWTAHYDSSFWNEGALLPSPNPNPTNTNTKQEGEREHPVNEFWPERFLSYPNDPLSGPIRTPNSLLSSSIREKPIEYTPTDDSNAKVTTSGLQDYFFPYGGGSTICPGRHFAKQEIIFTIAVIIRAFEIEAVGCGEVGSVGPDRRYSLMGNLPPDKRVRVRVRGRKEG